MCEEEERGEGGGEGVLYDDIFLVLGGLGEGIRSPQRDEGGERGRGAHGGGGGFIIIIIHLSVHHHHHEEQEKRGEEGKKGGWMSAFECTYRVNG